MFYVFIGEMELCIEGFLVLDIYIFEGLERGIEVGRRIMLGIKSV